MKISIVTPSFNQGEYLQQAIDSVIAQGYSDWEHIIYDGGSTDTTLSILEQYHKQFPNNVWFVSEPDKGQSDALNKALRKATGDVVVWLSTDDWFEPGAFNSIAGYFKTHPEVGMVYGRCIAHNTVGSDEKTYELPTQEFDLHVLLNDNNYMAYITVYWRRELLDTVGYFDERLHYSMDLDYYIRIAKQTTVAFIPEILGHFRIHEASKSGGQEDKFWKEWRQVSRKYGGDFFSAARSRHWKGKKAQWISRTPRWLRRMVYRVKKLVGITDTSSSVYDEMQKS